MAAVKLKNVISAAQFDIAAINSIFKTADKIKSQKYNKNALRGKIMATVFYEPSTRTRLSFEAAMQRLGGSVISTENAAEFSSAVKGETLEDTIKIVNGYSDVIVLRHFIPRASETAASVSRVPIINAGDGEGEHPTQALLDLYTIFQKSKSRSFTISMVGDLKFGRTVHSLARLICLYPKIKLIFVSPHNLKIPDDLRKELKQKSVKFKQTDEFGKDAKKSAFIYMTRIQKERFKDKKAYAKNFGRYILDKKTMAQVAKNTLILHPLPRVNEISAQIDSDPRALYFEQAQNGLFVRMALLLHLFDKA